LLRIITDLYFANFGWHRVGWVLQTDNHPSNDSGTKHYDPGNIHSYHKILRQLINKNNITWSWCCSSQHESNISGKRRWRWRGCIPSLARDYNIHFSGGSCWRLLLLRNSQKAAARVSELAICFRATTPRISVHVDLGFRHYFFRCAFRESGSSFLQCYDELQGEY
jgi:hypothetical protein